MAPCETFFNKKFNAITDASADYAVKESDMCLCKNFISL